MTSSSSLLDRFAANVESATGLSSDYQVKVLVTLVIALALWLVCRLIMRAVTRRTTDVRTNYMWRKAVTNTAAVIGILLIIRVWFVGLQHLATFFGLLTAGIAIALKDLLVNLVGWVFITWRKPFVVGDRIQIGSHAGDIIDLRIFQITLMEIGNWVGNDQPTGRIIHIPNGKVFTDAQANYTKAFRYIWNEIPVLVTFESNWREAKKLLEAITLRHTTHQSEAARASFREAARHFLISVSDIESRVYTTVQASGVLLTIRYLCDPHDRRITEQAIWEDILTTFSTRDDIGFAYPTTRFYDSAAEGKQDSRTSNTSPGNREG